MDDNINQIYQALPSNTLLVIPTLQGDANYYIKLHKKAVENPLSVTQDELEKAIMAARKAISFFVIK